jgi:hypothetical protein
MDLTRPDRGEALSRLTDRLQSLPADEHAAYMTLMLAILAKNAPDVLTFLLDRADAALDAA